METTVTRYTAVTLDYPRTYFRTTEYLTATPADYLAGITGDRLAVADLKAGQNVTVAHATGDSTVWATTGILTDDAWLAPSGRWLLEFKSHDGRVVSVSVTDDAVAVAATAS